MDILSLRVSDLGLPLARPLPMILTYAKRAQQASSIPSVLEEEFYAHIDCLVDLVETSCLRAGIPASLCKEVCQKAADLSRSPREEIVSSTNALLHSLTRMAQIHKSPLKAELSANPQIYRDIYWGRVYTKRVVLVHHGEADERLAKLERSLQDACSYEVTVAPEKDLTIKPMTSDFVVFRPTRGPIRPASLSAATTLGLPVLILVDLGKQVETADPVMVRTALLYAKAGHTVLHRPFTALRLFTAVDSCYVTHLFHKPFVAAARAKGAVA